MTEKGYRQNALPKKGDDIPIEGPPLRLRLSNWWKEFKVPKFWKNRFFWLVLWPGPAAITISYCLHWSRIPTAISVGSWATWVVLVTYFYVYINE